jgi:hypothetical protein
VFEFRVLLCVVCCVCCVFEFAGHATRQQLWGLMVGVWRLWDESVSVESWCKGDNSAAGPRQADRQIHRQRPDDRYSQGRVFSTTSSFIFYIGTLYFQCHFFN